MATVLQTKYAISGKLLLLAGALCRAQSFWKIVTRFNKKANGIEMLMMQSKPLKRGEMKYIRLMHSAIQFIKNATRGTMLLLFSDVLA